MLSNELIVDVPALTAAAATIQQIAGSVGDQPFDDYLGTGMGAPGVQEAAIEFASVWARAVLGLCDAIDRLRTSMGSAVEVYQSLDERLAGSATPGQAR